MVTTLTVVGYGADLLPVVSPDKNSDTILTISFIYFGTLLFSIFTGSLRMMFSSN